MSGQLAFLVPRPSLLQNFLSFEPTWTSETLYFLSYTATKFKLVSIKYLLYREEMSKKYDIEKVLRVCARSFSLLLT